MRRHAVPPAIVLLVLACAPRPALAAGGFLHLSGYSSKVAGELTGDPGSSERISVDLDDDVGFDAALAAEGRAGLRLGRHRFQGAGAIFDHEAERSESGFELGGSAFGAEATFRNKLRWAEAEYGLALLDDDRLRLEVLAGVRLVRYEGEAEGRLEVGGVEVASGREEVDETGPVPHLGVAFEARPVDRLVLRGYGKGLVLGVGDDEGEELDVEATVGVRVGSAVELGAGGRYLKLFVSIDEEATTFDFDYAALAFYVRFGG
jgi:hypothetical protein